MNNIKKSNFELVGDFMRSCDQEVLVSPKLPESFVSDLRIKLIKEEVSEFIEALENKDLENVAKELADILYVVYGAGHSFGIDLDKCFIEVHESNMTKLGPDGKVVRREDGKIMKPDSYIPANIKKVLGL